MDDYQRVVTPDEVKAALKAKMGVTRARKGSAVDDFDLHAGEQGGVTVYIGNRKEAQQFVRVYDKLLESRGQINAVRWELVTKKRAADKFMRQLVAADREVGALVRTKLTSFIDFREVTGDSNSARRPRVNWYESLVGGIRNRLQTYDPRPTTTYEQRKEWVLKQVAPTLGVIMERELRESGNLDALNEIADSGKARWRGRHRALLDG